MRFAVSTLAILLALLATAPAGADCFYYDCNEYMDGSATCDKITQCASASCAEAEFFAQTCSVTCSKMHHGDDSVCWCSPAGTCYDI